MTITARVDPAGGGVEASASTGQPIAMSADGPGNTAALPEPMEVLLAALAGCTAMDVASILRKKRQRATTYDIEVSGQTVEEPPRVFSSITVEHRVSGDVGSEPLRRSIELSATRYCPVNAMLSAVARVEHRYLLVDAAGTTHEATVAVVGPNREVRVIPGA